MTSITRTKKKKLGRIDAELEDLFEDLIGKSEALKKLVDKPEISQQEHTAAYNKFWDAVRKKFNVNEESSLVIDPDTHIVYETGKKYSTTITS